MGLCCDDKRLHHCVLRILHAPDVVMQTTLFERRIVGQYTFERLPRSHVTGLSFAYNRQVPYTEAGTVVHPRWEARLIHAGPQGPYDPWGLRSDPRTVPQLVEIVRSPHHHLFIAADTHGWCSRPCVLFPVGTLRMEPVECPHVGEAGEADVVPYIRRWIR